MYAERHIVNLVTDAEGNAVGYTPVVIGRVLQIHYLKTDFADGVDFDVTGETTGQVIWDQDNVNAAAIVAPRQATHTTAGAAAVYAAGGSAVLEPIVVAGERIKVQVANGGDTKSGQVQVVIG
jgi:hypothetical protein